MPTIAIAVCHIGRLYQGIAVLQDGTVLVTQGILLSWRDAVRSLYHNILAADYDDYISCPVNSRILTDAQKQFTRRR